MFEFETQPGVKRPALFIAQHGGVAEIIVFLSNQDAAIHDISGDLTRNPRLLVDADKLNLSPNVWKLSDRVSKIELSNATKKDVK